MLNEIIDPATDSPTMSLLNNLRFGTTNIEQPRVDTVELWRIVNTTADTHPIHLHLVQFQVVRRQAFDVDGYLAAVNRRLVGGGLPEPSATGLGPSPAVDPTPYLLGTPQPRPSTDASWKDTVEAHPGEVLTIRVPFGGTAGGLVAAPFTASFTGRYVWHCHILEHEDNEMMLPYQVRP
jgi:spore coat protein A